MTRIDKLKAERDGARRRSEQRAKHLEDAYREKMLLIAALSTVWPSHLSLRSGIKERSDTPETRACVVCVHSPAGQLAWIVTNWELAEYFSHLPKRSNDWDGHQRTERLARLASLAHA